MHLCGSWELESHIDAIHGLLLNQVTGYESELAANALSALSLLRQRAPDRVEDRPVTVAVTKAKLRMESGGDEPKAIPELARSLGVAYSYFRREFRRRTGFAPQQYQLRMRLQRAQRLLGATDQSIKQVSEQLGFSSPFHLSAAFKAHFRVPPSVWRRRNDRSDPQ